MTTTDTVQMWGRTWGKCKSEKAGVRCGLPGYVDGYCHHHCDCDELDRHRERKATWWAERRAKRALGPRSAWMLDDGTEVLADRKPEALKLAAGRRIVAVRLRW